MGVIENLQNAEITPINTSIVDNISNAGSIGFVRDTINKTTEGWAVFVFLGLLYMFAIYMMSRNSNQQDVFKNWIWVSTVHVLLSIIIFAIGWMPGWQKFLWGILVYLIGIIFAYIFKPKYA